MDIIFRVSGQTIARLDNNEIAAGSANFLRARFELSSDWLSDATPLVFKAVFEKDGAAYHVLLDDDLTCDVAPEVLKERGYFYVGLIGLSPENTEEIVRITTIRENVYVSDGSSVTAANNFAVSQDEIEQAIAKLAALGLKLSVIHSVDDMEGLCLIESVNYWFCWLGADETKYGDAVLLPGGVYSITFVDGGYVLAEDDSLRGPRGFTGDKGEPGEALKVVRSSDELKTWCEGLASNVNFAYCLAGGYFEFSFELGSATLSGDMDEGDVWRFSRVDYSFDFCYSIIGEDGYTPQKGVDYFDGKSAYEYAQDGGYTGTEEEFADKLASDTVNPDKVIFPEDVYTTYSFGKVETKNGEMVKLLDKGSNLNDLMDLLVDVRYPEITEPSVSLEFVNAKAYEVGTVVPINFSAVLNPGSYTYGPNTGITAESWKVTDTEGNENELASGSFPDLTVKDNTNYSITAEATHGEGIVPLTNTKAEYPEGKISAGAKSATSKAVTGFRAAFYGTVTNKDALTSSIIRSLTKSGKILVNGSSFTLDVPIGAVRVIIAYPATLRDITSIKDVNGLNAEISSGFTKTTLSVEGANGYTAASYKIYYMDFANANDKANKFTVAI